MARETAGRGGRERGRLPSAALPPRVGVIGHWRSLRTFTGTSSLDNLFGVLGSPALGLNRRLACLVPGVSHPEYAVNLVESW